jgi:hypothetical protein
MTFLLYLLDVLQDGSKTVLGNGTQASANELLKNLSSALHSRKGCDDICTR